MKEKIVEWGKRLGAGIAARWKGMTDAGRILFLFLTVSLTAALIFLFCSIGQYAHTLSIPVEELDTGKSLASSEPFLWTWARLFYQNPLFFQDRDDIFMDWFNINFMVYENSPYIGGDSSYPPLVLNIAKLFASMADYDLGAGEARNSAAGILSIWVFYAVGTIPTLALVLVACRKKGLALWKGALLCLAFLCSTPFLFEFDRGNYLLLAIPFVLAFFLWYDSERAILRELSYLSLAVAVGIKIYPAAFALLLLKEKRFAGFARTACYSVLLLIVPFFFFEGGLDNIAAFLYWLSDFSGSKGGTVNTVAYGVSYSYSPYNFPAAIAAMLGPGILDMDVDANALIIEKIGKFLTYFFILLILFAGLASDRRWKVMLASGLATLFVPSISFVYSATMIAVPILFFLLDREKRKLDYAYLVLFLIAFVPGFSPYLVGYETVAFRWGVTLANFMQQLSYIAMLGLLTAEAAIRLWKNRQSLLWRIKKRQNH